MTNVEERIKQKAWSLGALEDKINRNRFSVRRGIPTYDVDKKYLQELLAEKWIPEKEVLQILAEQNVKWCELLKLLQEFPLPDGHPLLHFSVQEWKEKIEEKLKATEKLMQGVHPALQPIKNLDKKELQPT